MKRKLRKVRGGFIPRTPFYKKYRTGATTSRFRSVVIPAPRRQPMDIPLYRGSTRAARGLGAQTKTEPRLAPANVKKTVKKQTEMRRQKRRTFKYLPVLRGRRNLPTLSRRPKSLSSGVKPVGDGASRSFYRSGRPAKPKMFGIGRMSPEQVYQNVFTGREVGGAGRQAVWSTDVGNLVDLQAVVLGKQLASPLNQIYVKSYTRKYMFTNTALTNVFIDLYECVPRRAIQTDAITAFSSGIQQMQPTESAISIMTTPFQSRFFTQNWLIKKVFRIELAAGRTHIHTAKYNINALYSSEINQAGSTATHQPKFTRTNLCIAYSELANTLAGPTVTFAPVSINTFVSEDIRWHFGETELKDIVYSGLSTGQINTTGLQIYDEGSGAVEAVVAA